MRLFKPKSIPGWFLVAFSLCWRFLEVWTGIEFVFKKLWSEKPMMPTLTAIESSSWFPLVLMLVGLAWIWWFSRPKVERFISLSEAVEKLRKEGLKQTHCGYSMDSHSRMRKIDDEYDRLAKYFTEYVDIYGKKPSLIFDDWIIINEDIIRRSEFKKMALELHLKNDNNSNPIFIDLAIKKDDLDRAIEQILSFYTIYQG